jgi:hypothetical protein
VDSRAFFLVHRKSKEKNMAAKKVSPTDLTDSQGNDLVIEQPATERTDESILHDFLENAFVMDANHQVALSDDFKALIVDAVNLKMRKHGHLDKVVEPKVVTEVKAA